MFWVRATLPRMRVDRLMNFAWKYLVPLSIVNILVAAVWYECYLSRPGRSSCSARRCGRASLPMNWLISSVIMLLILVPSFLVVLAINRWERAAAIGTAPARRPAPVPVAAR